MILVFQTGVAPILQNLGLLSSLSIRLPSMKILKPSLVQRKEHQVNGDSSKYEEVLKLSCKFGEFLVACYIFCFPCCSSWNGNVSHMVSLSLRFGSTWLGLQVLRAEFCARMNHTSGFTHKITSFFPPSPPSKQYHIAPTPLPCSNCCYTIF